MDRLVWYKEEVGVLSNLCGGTPGKECADLANMGTAIPCESDHQVLSLCRFGMERFCSNYGSG